MEEFNLKDYLVEYQKRMLKAMNEAQQRAEEAAAGVAAHQGALELLNVMLRELPQEVESE